MLYEVITVVEGVSFAKGIYIISDKGEEVADRIIKEVERGVTSLYGRGMYTRTDKLSYNFV